MGNASGAGAPFYVQVWLHMSHATIDPRPEQYADVYPFNLTCGAPRTAAFAAANPGGNGTATFGRGGFQGARGGPGSDWPVSTCN